MTIELLESQLTQTNITVLMVTHDRYFLERVCTHIYELTKQSIQTYDGNYSYYLTKKAERMLMADIAFHKLSQRYKAELERVRKSPRARESKSREREERFEKLHETLRETKSTRKETSMTLTLDLKERRLGDKIIKIHKLHKSFPLHQ
jgi:ATP-binding cassette subfamily F protein uup